MSKFIISEVILGLVQLDWTIIFQLLNTVLWILIIYAIYTYFKRSKMKQKMLENRLTQLEEEVNKLSNKK